MSEIVASRDADEHGRRLLTIHDRRRSLTQWMAARNPWEVQR